MEEDLDLDMLPYWDHEEKKLLGSRWYKAHRFLDRIRKVADDEYYVFPIRGYNRTIHVVRRTSSGWECDCQYYNMTGRPCSHILAVILYIKRMGGKHE